MSASPGFELKGKIHPVEHMEHHGIGMFQGTREVVPLSLGRRLAHSKMYGAGPVGSHLIL